MWVLEYVQGCQGYTQSLLQPMKPPLGKDGPGLFFLSCGEWDLTALLNVLAHFHCASVSTYWQDQLKWENKPLIWSECWAQPLRRIFQLNFGFPRTSLFCAVLSFSSLFFSFYILDYSCQGFVTCVSFQNMAFRFIYKFSWICFLSCFFFHL